MLRATPSSASQHSLPEPSHTFIRLQPSLNMRGVPGSPGHSSYHAMGVCVRRTHARAAGIVLRTIYRLYHHIRTTTQSTGQERKARPERERTHPRSQVVAPAAPSPALQLVSLIRTGLSASSSQGFHHYTWLQGPGWTQCHRINPSPALPP